MRSGDQRGGKVTKKPLMSDEKSMFGYSVKSKHLFILKHGDDARRKTDYFEVYGYKNAYLGCVFWSGGWRQYVFHPVAGCQWSHDCLLEISQFVKAQMDLRKTK